MYEQKRVSYWIPFFYGSEVLMMRILVLIAIGLLLYVIIGNLLRKNRNSTPLISERMVQCKYCNLHILEQEAVKSGSDYFCSQEHLDIDSNTK